MAISKKVVQQLGTGDNYWYENVASAIEIHSVPTAIFNSNPLPWFPKVEKTWLDSLFSIR